jgi:hypothetical protein
MTEARLNGLQSTPASLSERLRMDMKGSIPEEGPTTPTGQRRMMETWIVLELCNRGSLQVWGGDGFQCQLGKVSHQKVHNSEEVLPVPLGKFPHKEPPGFRDLVLTGLAKFHRTSCTV